MLVAVLFLVPVVVAAPSAAPVPVVEWLPLVLAALLGAVASRLLIRWERRTPIATVRLGRGSGFRPFPGLPGVGDGHAVWFAPADELPALLLQLATRLATRGPVLLLPRPDRRSELWAEIGPSTAPIFATELLRPSARQALEAAARIVSDGQLSVVIVDGAGALEPAPADRPDAAVRELLDGASVPVFVVLPDGDPVPGGKRRTVVRVRRSAAGFERAPT